MYIAISLVGAYLFGLALYAIFANTESPEGFWLDVEHDSKGNLLPKTSVRYWFNVVVEGLFSWPAHLLRKLFGR